MATTAHDTTILAALQQALGTDAVIEAGDRLDYFANDVYRSGARPLAVVRPTSIEALQEAVRLCNETGVAMVPRGGGASYTDGYVRQEGGHVLFDTGALDTLEIDEENAIVTCEAGVTWANLKAALDAKGLRTPFWGPFSGIAATVGGSVSQNTLSHGTTMHGISAQSVISMDVVLADGSLLSTSASKATRFYGPDLTGLFTGDCGIFGIKARIRLPLLPVLPKFECLSYAFDSFADYHKASRKAALARLDDSHFGLDLALSQGQIGRQEGVGARLKIAADILRKAPNKLKGLAQLVKMALAGEDAMKAGAYMCHFILEGADQDEATLKAKQLRRLLDGIGREIANSIPTFVHSVPFAPLFNVLGPGGERWVPIHGVLAHDQAVAFDAAFKALIESRKAEMEKLGVWIGTMFSPTGPTGFLYEVALYWPEDRTAYHKATLGEEYLGQQPQFAKNPDASAFVDELKEAIIAVYQEYGAGHFQLGRAYPYQQRLSVEAKSLLSAIKSELDPKGLMNPGALGF
ncbi:FAD-binding oxidoreductase [Novosphingobium profundi]|uniref:FAD-binding oxidoreductase n=1 Tax=Novosphingobium profundi TaxID=1774954 RepID=UPI001BDB15C5|nr:FAD-binding oxidoreductase [Novosphingobium profundi]MBT0671649.1 FAD-binding oxidoreductase [Novosphingobium profundi]